MIFMTAIVISQGNRSAIGIKDFVVQIICLPILALSALHLLYNKDTIFIPKAPLAILPVVYGMLMTGTYLVTSRCSANYQALTPQLLGIVIFILIIHHFRKADVGRLIHVSVAAAVISSIYGILQYFRLDPLTWEHIGAFGTLRVVSFFGNKNYFAIFLLLMIPLGGYVALTSETKMSMIVGAIATALMISALALSFSKGALISFFLSGTISIGLLILKKRKTARKERGGRGKFRFLIFCIPLAMMMVIVAFSPDIWKDYTKRLKHRNHYIMQRVSYCQVALEIIGNHPFFGVGPGNFARFHPQNETHRVNTSNPNHVLNHVHNDLLEIAAEYGLFSLLAYGGILLIFFYEWANRFKNADQPDQQLALILICGSISGYLFYSLLTVAGRYMSSVFYFWVVMGIGYLHLSEDDPDKNKFISIPNWLMGRKTLSFAVAITIFLIFGVTCKKTLANHVSDVYISKAYGLVSQRDYDKALEYLNRSIQLQGHAVEAYYQRGFVHFSKNRVDKAIADYYEVKEMMPNYVNVDFNLASCFYKKEDWEKAIQIAEVSHKRFPDYLAGMMLLAYTHYQMGQYQKAMTTCDQVLKRYKGHKAALSLRKKLKAF